MRAIFRGARWATAVLVVSSLGAAADSAPLVDAVKRSDLSLVAALLQHGADVNDATADGTTVTLERETLHLADGDTAIALVETRTSGTDRAPAQVVRGRDDAEMNERELPDSDRMIDDDVGDRCRREPLVQLAHRLELLGRRRRSHRLITGF